MFNLPIITADSILYLTSWGHLHTDNWEFMCEKKTDGYTILMLPMFSSNVLRKFEYTGTPESFCDAAVGDIVTAMLEFSPPSNIPIGESRVDINELLSEQQEQF